eukprot:8086485-Pyramimonas_sp.AAC.1
MSAYEGLKAATGGWFCRPLPKPMATAALPKGELEPFLKLANDVGDHETRLSTTLTSSPGTRTQSPPSLTSCTRRRGRMTSTT